MLKLLSKDKWKPEIIKTIAKDNVGIKELYKAIKKGDTKYTAVDGTPALKKAVIKKFKRENKLNFSND